MGVIMDLTVNMDEEVGATETESPVYIEPT
jgi:hypothetical protein